ncbi:MULTISPECIES: hypothetical protein [Bacillaceae]|uniref:hypothetical protein n=1 Tax=Bacillaceae TaxID=186817 RepID=UPI0004E112B3|nr:MULTISPECIES: hypothetical protein [Bacillaceae]MCF2650483.1 hypothetical protein [Niallia circulans]MCM3364760.1 hypothetical protein [Niallia sp. MER TA 168]CAI9391548.1 hypothetical protein BACSP_03044 [Bacillus sp. T2.9-1]
MNYFFKLNIVSIIYALMVFIPLELILNVYRIARLTNWEFSTVNIVTCVTVIIVMVGATILLHFLTKKWLDGRKAKFWTVLLWVPYFILFIYVFASLFPMTNGGDEPNPVTGLFVMGGLIAYPFYILILNFVGVPSEDKTM